MKRIVCLLSLFAVLSFFTSPVFGQTEAKEKSNFFTIGSFEKGLNSHVDPYLVPDAYGSLSENLRYNEVFGGASKRDALRYFGTIGSSPVKSIHRLYKTDGIHYLMASGADKIYYADDTTGAFTALKTNLTENKRWSFINYQDVAIGFNGFDNPVKWDGRTFSTADTEGHRTANNLMAGLGAPFAELDEGSNLDASSWYQYRVAYKTTTDVYYYSTARSNPIQTGSTHKAVKLTGIPQGPTGTEERIIYRTEGNSSQAAVEADIYFYPVTTIKNNIDTEYEDDNSDYDMMSQTPSWNFLEENGFDVTPPNGTIAKDHKERLFVAGNKTNLSDIYWSDTFNPDYFDPNDSTQIRPDDGGKITFLDTFLGILTVGKTNSIQKFYTQGSSASWEVSEPMSYVGCVAPYSAQVTPKGIFYLARDGLYRFYGQGSELISDSVTPEIRGILSSKYEDSVGFYYKNEYLLAYTEDVTPAELNHNRILVYDLTRNAYSIDIVDIDSFASLDAGNDFGLLAMGSSASDGKIYISGAYTSQMSKLLKSWFDDGTYTDARTTGEETTPEMEISWDITIDEAVGTIDGHTYGDPAGSAIIDRDEKAGTWVSPAINVGSTDLYTLFWNEDLNTYGDITFQIRTAATEAGLTSESWSSTFTNQNGSDLSGISADEWMQIKINLSTSDIKYSPYAFVRDGYLLRVTYKRDESDMESDVPAIWQSGWEDFNVNGRKKLLQRAKIYYQGTAGGITVTYENDDNNVNDSFSIDLTQTSTADVDLDGYYEYKGGDGHKIFTYMFPQNSPTNDRAVGEFWRFTVEDTSASNEDWTLERIQIQYTVEEEYD